MFHILKSKLSRHLGRCWGGIHQNARLANKFLVVQNCKNQYHVSNSNTSLKDRFHLNPGLENWKNYLSLNK